jgi:ankyrin repeat protein
MHAAGKYGTALQAVAYQGHLEIVTLLLDKGANPNVQGASPAIMRIYN